jgi:hypothetical protein
MTCDPVIDLKHRCQGATAETTNRLDCGYLLWVRVVTRRNAERAVQLFLNAIGSCNVASGSSAYPHHMLAPWVGAKLRVKGNDIRDLRVGDTG